MKNKYQLLETEENLDCFNSHIMIQTGKGAEGRVSMPTIVVRHEVIQLCSFYVKTPDRTDQQVGCVSKLSQIKTEM
jgi:hypothetical protein